MPLGILFWILMVLWFVLGLYSNRDSLKAGSYGLFGGSLLLFILLGLLGWRVFGPVIQ